ncbi:DHH family phosphoesterase [Desulfuromonas thiophila]|uniref:DHH family phosphoesterase n=1 Tax=Desulfuromonas thiophila TaxID=57664 RepID=UPI0024A83B48|nr:DHH family phosphoesterase [Desulfuromonas thiophila]
MDSDRSLSFSERIVARARGRRNILILTHDNPDPDALASAHALAHLLLAKTGNSPRIACGGVIGRRENRTMVERLQIAVEPLARVDVRTFDLFCLVDAQPGTGNTSLSGQLPIDIIIDHHPLRCRSEDNQIVDIRPDYGACATILFEYLQQQKVYLNSRLATALFYAIRSETQDLGREWTSPDRLAYQQLLLLSNNRVLFDIAHAKVPRSYFASFNQALESARVYREALVFNLAQIPQPDIVAEMADFLLRMEGVHLVLGMGWHRGEEVLSLRTDREDWRAGTIIRQLVAELGTAGGHGMIAGGQIRQVAGDVLAQNQLQQLLTERLFTVLGYDPEAGEALL